MNRKVEFEINERIDTNEISILFKGKSIGTETSMIEIDLNNGRKFQRQIKKSQEEPIEIIHKEDKPSSEKIYIEWVYYKNEDEYKIAFFVNNEFIKTDFVIAPVINTEHYSLLRRIYNKIMKKETSSEEGNISYMILNLIFKELLRNSAVEINFKQLNCTCVNNVGSKDRHINVIENDEYNHLLNTILGFRSSRYMVNDLIESERSIYSKEDTIKMVDRLFSFTCIHIKKMFEVSSNTNAFKKISNDKLKLDVLKLKTEAVNSLPFTIRSTFESIALNSDKINKLLV